MPNNILVHGFSRGSNGAPGLKKKIDLLLQAAGLANISTTTFLYYSDPRTCDGKYTPKPYLEIRSDDEASLDAVSAVLEKLDMDIQEMIILRSFKPGKKTEI